LKSKKLVIYLALFMASASIHSFADSDNESMSVFCSESRTHKDSQICMDYIAELKYNKENKIIDKNYNKIISLFKSYQDKRYRNRLLENLKSSELDWIKYKKAFCSTVGDKYYGGSIRGLEQTECLIYLTKIQDNILINYFYINSQDSKLQNAAYAKDGIHKLEKYAKNGNAQAEYVLGNDYYFGQGVPQNRAKAKYWFKKSAAQGNVDAENNLGVIYSDGLDGLKSENDAKATYWWKKAAAQGSAEAAYNLGGSYYKRYLEQHPGSSPFHFNPLTKDGLWPMP
jgi:uncharacterized protein YecT (DUF1311 family)